MTHEEIFEANMPLAVFAMRKYRGEYGEDDLQEAYIALWRAVERYDEGKGAFSYYAVRAILNEMRKKDKAEGRDKRRVNKMAESLTVYDLDERDGERDIPCLSDMDGEAAVSEFWRRARNELPAREYDMLRRREAGESAAEIALAYGMSKQAVLGIIGRRPRRLAEAVFGC